MNLDLDGIKGVFEKKLDDDILKIHSFTRFNNSHLNNWIL